jgi:hypothetical protein
LTASLTLCAALMALAPVAEAVAPPTPEQYLGFRVGSDRKLASWEQVNEYLRILDAASDRVSIESAGSSTQGRDLPIVVVTSEENQQRLPRIREIARRLADAADLLPADVEALAREGRAVVLVTCSIHATEVGSTQMSMELVHELATTADGRVRGWLDEVVLLLMPSINPDGQVIVRDWYQKQLGTEFEGGPLPWLYHPYVGHDNNRDFTMLTQKETLAVNDVLYRRWFPQVFLDEHQMGSTGPRMFVPPQADPLAAEVDSLIFRQADLLGTGMSLRLEEAGKTGVGHDMIFDSYWPGGTRNTAWWKGIVGLLTEVASARIATPITIDAGELRGGEKGLPEYQRRSNFPSPWPGGAWRLRDVVEYELVATKALLETVAAHREGFLRNRAAMARAATAAGRNGAPYAWVIPPDQHDPSAAAKLVELLLRHGIAIGRAATAFDAGATRVPAGAHVISAAQPYRAFLLTMLRSQRYPEVTAYSGGPILPPYDVTSWSFPTAMGVTVQEIEQPLTATIAAVDAPAWPGRAPPGVASGYRIAAAQDSAAVAVNRLLARAKGVYRLAESSGAAKAGDFFVPATALSPAEAAELARLARADLVDFAPPTASAAWRLKPVRLGLYKPWIASMDEGWTRFLLERYEFPHQSLANEDFRKGGFGAKVDAVFFADVDKKTIEKGDEEDGRSRYPAEYRGGLGKEGGEALKKWILGGGTAIALDSSGEYFIDLLGLPVTNALAKVDEARFNAPGSMLRVLVDTAHPLGYGLRAEEAAYFADSPAYQTSVPDARFTRTVVARYPDDERDIAWSGYLKGGDLLEKRAAVVELTAGKGRVILIGFRAQHRAQTVRTFKLLWNAIYRAKMEEAVVGR